MDGYGWIDRVILVLVTCCPNNRLVHLTKTLVAIPVQEKSKHHVKLNRLCGIEYLWVTSHCNLDGSW